VECRGLDLFGVCRGSYVTSDVLSMSVSYTKLVVIPKQTSSCQEMNLPPATAQHQVQHIIATICLEPLRAVVYTTYEPHLLAMEDLSCR